MWKRLIVVFCLVVLSVCLLGASDIIALNKGVYIVENEKSLIDIFVQTAKTTSTLVTALISLALPFILWLTKSEIPASQRVLFPGVGFVYLFLLRFSLHISNPDFWVTIFGILFFVGFLIWSLYLHKNVLKKSLDSQIIVGALSPEKRVCGYFKRHIHKCHPVIESLQLYSISETSEVGETTYQIKYIDGYFKNDVEINAVLSLHLVTEKCLIEKFKAIIDQFDLYNDGVADTLEKQEALREFLKRAIVENVDELRRKLAVIDSVDSINVSHCCIARLIVAYLSILGCLEKEVAVGLEENSLGLAADIEQVLFTQKRTGLLGAILLKKYSYIFSYKRIGDKEGRFYYTFLCDSGKNKYAALVALRNKDNVIRIDIGVFNALRSIEDNLKKILSVNKVDDGGE